MKGKAVVLACGMLLLPIAASAAVVDVFETFDRGSEDERQQVSFMLEATVAGFGAVNETLKIQGRPMLYCAPEKINLMGEQLVDILRRFVEDKRPQLPFLGKLGPPQILLLALRDAFPCTK